MRYYIDKYQWESVKEMKSQRQITIQVLGNVGGGGGTPQ